MTTPHILVVDDDRAIRDFLSMVLQDEGYEVAEAENGIIALDMLPQIRPDLILLDMLMPIMDGPAFMDAYQNLNIPPRPIIMLSASNRIDQSAARLPVSGYLAKPFDLDELLSCVSKSLDARV